MSEGARDRTHTAMMLWEGACKSNKWVRNRTTELGKHVRRFNVTEDSLFVVLWGGNKASEGGNGSRMMGGDEEEGDSASTALAETTTSGSLVQPICRMRASILNKQLLILTAAEEIRDHTIMAKDQILWNMEVKCPHTSSSQTAHKTNYSVCQCGRGTTNKLQLLHLSIIFCLNKGPVCTVWTEHDIQLLYTYNFLSNTDKEVDKDLHLLSSCTYSFSLAVTDFKSIQQTTNYFWQPWSQSPFQKTCSRGREGGWNHPNRCDLNQYYIVCMCLFGTKPKRTQCWLLPFAWRNNCL